MQAVMHKITNTGRKIQCETLKVHKEMQSPYFLGECNYLTKTNCRVNGTLQTWYIVTTWYFQLTFQKVMFGKLQTDTGTTLIPHPTGTVVTQNKKKSSYFFALLAQNLL
jgi:hypothetical protein